MKKTAMAWVLLGLAPVILMGLTGCQTMKEHKKTTGAVLGAATGAAAGAVIGHQSGNRTEGALIGAAAGAAIGTGVGALLSRQAEQLEKIEDVEVQTDQTAGNEHLVVRMSSEVLFEKSSSALKPQGLSRLAEIAVVLRESPESRVIIKGYASAEGEDEYNMKLSQRRADSVRNALIGERVAQSRISALGMGESNPIAGNDTEAGRASNRRVEIEVFPGSEIR